MFRSQCTFQLLSRNISYLLTQCEFQFQVRFRCTDIAYNVLSCKLSCCKLLLWCKPIFRFNYSQWFPMWKIPELYEIQNARVEQIQLAGLPAPHPLQTCLQRWLPLAATPLAPSQRAIRGIGQGIRYIPLCLFPFSLLPFHLYFLKFSIPCNQWKFDRKGYIKFVEIKYPRSKRCSRR